MENLIYIVGALVLFAIVLQFVQLLRGAGLTARLEGLSRENERLERELREELVGARRDAQESARLLREDQLVRITQLGQSLGSQLGQMAQVQNGQIDSFGQQLAALTKGNEARFDELRTTVDQRLQHLMTDQRAGREETGNTLKRFGDGLGERFQEVRATLDKQLGDLQADNAKKLEEMRLTVDEKLHKTLEDRLASSFKTVSERLEQVHKGLGEMQTLAAGVGDLKRVLTNVKTRGTFGEVQLGTLLEQFLAPDQYVREWSPRRGERERVDYAVKMPGRDEEGTPVFLPIDAKFPQEDYMRLLEAYERADVEAIEVSGRALELRVKEEARSIRDKYVNPPVTTDFALLFLPAEGLYAEVLRRPGLTDFVQREYRVVVSGPTTLVAFLNSLQMGFRTLAIEKRSSEVWKVLGAVKTEFGRFSDVLARTREKLDEASKRIGDAEHRTRQMTRRLRKVEELPTSEAQALLESDEDDPQADG